MRSNRRLLLAFILPFFINSCYAEKTVQEHLVEGNQFLVTGKYNDAIISFDAAIGKFFFLKKNNKETDNTYSPLFFFILK